MADKPRRISEITYAIPFGRYVGAKQVVRGADEVLVGREGQRNYFIELLISTGRQGAYLVTGRRGAGKTSFVKHCINEYQASVFRRFLRGTVGRGFLDRFLPAAFWSALFAGALLVSEVGQILVPLATDRTGHLTLLWVALVPSLLLLLYPCLYARAAFEAIADSLAQRSRHQHKTLSSTVLGTVMTLSLAILIWLLPPFGDASLSLALLFAWLASAYLCVQALSFEALPSSDSTKTRFRSLAAVLSAVALFFVLLAFTSREVTSWRPAALLGGLYLGLGACLRGVYQHRLSHAIGRVHEEYLRIALRRGGKNYLWLPFLSTSTCGVALLLDGTVQFTRLNWATVSFLAGLLLALGSGIFLHFSCRGESEVIRRAFLPRPRFVLAIGAGISIVLSLQLAQPILAPLSDFVRTLAPTSFRPQGVDRLETPSDRVLGATSLVALPQHTLPEDWRHSLPVTPAPVLSGLSPFANRTDRLLWIFLAVLIFAALHYIEYEWIIRPYVRIREEGPGARSGSPRWEDLNDLTADEAWQHHRNFAELSLPWVVHRVWLPVVPVSVNLGFDAQLSASQILQAMLVGLRERYSRAFLSLGSTIGSMGRLLTALLLLILASLAGDAWFELPAHNQIESWQSATKDVPGASHQINEPGHVICNYLEATRSERKLLAADLACWAGDIWFMSLYYDLVPTSINFVSRFNNTLGEPLLFALLPYSNDNARPPAHGLSFFGFHVLLLLGFLVAGRWFLRNIPLLPYRRNLRQIDDLLDSMTTSTRITSTSRIWELARWIQSFATERTRETERGPLDSRTVELAFLQILDDLQTSGARLPGVARRHLHLPAPEITFIFDELDKLGTRVDPEDVTLRPVSQEFELLKSERQRALKLRALLSDLKNVLSAAPARFIFIGGRNLYDEWLADQTARQPLLTNIFNAVVYLPSLISDHASHGVPARTGTPEPLESRIDDYLAHQWQRAQLLYEGFLQKRWQPAFGFAVEATVDERFTAARLSRGATSLLRVVDAYDGRQIGVDEQSLLSDYLCFLTHRSAGNPKRLRDLLESFVRPTSSVVRREVRWSKFSCQHVLRFRDDEIFRIQLISTLFRHLVSTLEVRIVHRDDKVPTSILYLTDFMLKFHRRAFTWSNLERVDELAHVHRAPDLRDVQEEIVDLFSERFLHRIPNGMYSFRFRSDIAREVEYLSRQSPDESAALNFTLDESQSLKALYLAAMEPERERNAEQLAGLGELYEFDREFETARRYYRQAIEILDQDVIRTTGDSSVVAGIFHAGKSLSVVRNLLPWAEARLRLMLQIGLTHEISRNLERAEVEYRNARSLARSVIRACLGGLGSGSSDSPDGIAKKGRLQTLKHLSILFQPLFAQAWIAEKLFTAVDTSITLLEGAIEEARTTLPFVREGSVSRSRNRVNPSTSSHGNFLLTMSQLHGKTGDIYFFKGIQNARAEDLLPRHSSAGQGAEQGRGPDQPTDGYSLRAHYHYAMSLHDLRRFTWQRLEESKRRFSIAPGGASSETLHREALGDFLWRSAAITVNDMAEATLARVSIVRTLRDAWVAPTECKRGKPPELLPLFLEWLSSSDDGGTRGEDKWAFCLAGTDGSTLIRTTLSNWFGILHPGTPGDNRLRFPNGADDSRTRLAMSLNLCRLGSQLFEAGGYPEDAARELLQVCETVTRYLWWMACFRALKNYCRPPGPGTCGGECREDLGGVLNSIPENGWSEGTEEYWRALAALGVECLRNAARLFRHSRSSTALRNRQMGKEPGGYLVGDVIPPDAVTLACSLGVWASLEVVELVGLKASVEKLLCEWGVLLGADFQEVLARALTRHRFPFLNRLQGLKVLVDAAALAEPEPESASLVFVEELLDSEVKYAAPLHFTPLQSGVSYAMMWLRLTKGSNDLVSADRTLRERLFRAAQRNLRLSEEMFTMRRAFYENITDLYYLYDDFNDRQIHYQHAIQMAGSDLTAVLRHLLHEAERRFSVEGTRMAPAAHTTSARPE